MATLVRKTAYLKINDIDLSAFVMDEGQPTHTRSTQPAALPSGGKADTFVTGYKRAGRFSCVLAQDFATGGPDHTLRALEGTVVPVVYRADGSVAKGAANPEYSFNIFFSTYSPVNGATGRTSRVVIDEAISGEVTRDPV